MIAICKMNGRKNKAIGREGGGFDICSNTVLRGSLPNSGPLDFVTNNPFPLFFVSEEALVGIY